MEFLRSHYRISNELSRKLLAEFLATTLLMYLGFSVGAQTLLSRSQLNGSIGVSIGWGLSLIFAAQMSFYITGAHLNPAISFVVWTYGQISFAHFLLYSLVQTLGAFFGAFLTFALYFDAINEYDGGIRQTVGPNATAGLFATYPAAHLSVAGGIIDQVSCTAVLAVLVGVITDEKNRIPKWAQPPMLGMMLMVICLGFGLNAGNAMNPARDLGPRLFTLLAGYGVSVFTHPTISWFLVPIVCPFVGAFIGSWLYQLTIGIQFPDELPTNNSQTHLLSESPQNISPQTTITNVNQLTMKSLHSIV